MIHLHVHNEYSVLDGFGSAEAYAKEAKRLGQKILSLTNHGNVDGCLKFQVACAKEGVVPIFGAELYVVEDAKVKNKDDRRRHLLVLAETEEGWRNLLKIITFSNLVGFYRRPRTDPSVILDNSSGLVFLTGCASSLLHESWGKKLVRSLIKKNGPDSVYGEVMPHRTKDQRDTNLLTLSFSKKEGIGVVATNDCHYPQKGDDKAQELLLAIQTRKTWDDPDRWRFEVRGLYLKTAEEMKEAFRRQGVIDEGEVSEYLANTDRLGERISRSFGQIKRVPVELPRISSEFYLRGEDDEALFLRLCREGLKKLIAGKLPRKNFFGDELSEKLYTDRLEEEMRLIIDLKFPRYFLIVWELINWCARNDILTGPGRGSVGGSLVAWAMGITKCDPLEHRLVFSRFISPARIDLPDIDMDFEDAKREQVREHLETVYGKSCVAGISTFSTMKGRGALRDVSRVFRIPNADVDAAAKSIVVRSGGDLRADYTIADAFETFEDGKRFKKKYPEVSRLAMKMEGQVRGLGQHAAGICVSPEDLSNGKRCSLSTRSGTVVVNWDKYDAEHFGLMKLDVLGLSALSVLSYALRMIKSNHDITVDLDSLPLTDDKVFKEVSRGHTVGAFQLGSPGLAKYCSELGVECFNDIVNATSLWRPGTLRSGMATEFVLRKKKGSRWDSIHPMLDNITRDTLGIILYQEQVMTMMYDLAGIPWKTCDIIRKVISKSQGDALFAQFEQQFVEGCKTRKTLSERIARKAWKDLTTFGSYGFNRSHAVEYSMITYWDMWLKIYYPEEFMAASLTYSGEDKADALIRESRRIGLSIFTPKVGLSEGMRWFGKNRGLFAPMRSVKGIGPAACDKIEKFVAESGDKGFFRPGGKALPTALRTILERIKAFDKDAVLSDEEIDAVSGLFSFDLSPDPMRRIRGIRDTLSPWLYSVKDIAEVRKKGKYRGSDRFLVVGRIDDLRFGYRKNVTRGSDAQIKGTKENLGGVYGFFRDDESTDMLVFSGELYNRRKEDVEHCSGQWILVEVEITLTNIIARDLWTEDDLVSATGIGRVGTDLLRETISIEGMKKYLSELSSCGECGESKKPVLPSLGERRIVILGEAPGKNEDLTGKGFVGASGKLLFEELNRHGIEREQCFVSNVVKCVQKGPPTPACTSRCCSTWLVREMKMIRPYVVLALGNTPLFALTGERSGITSKNGTTQWVHKINAWVCWCLHPASVLYSPDNRKEFSRGISNFRSVVKSLGAKLKTSVSV